MCRRVLILTVLGLLGGCGFHPLYGSGPDGREGPAAEGLAQISVGLIPERSGQLLRLALQERFERSGIVAPRRFDLSVSFNIASEGIGIQPDSSNTRVRLVGTANYRLIAQDPSRTTLTSGTARSVDGLDIFDQQLFAADLETEVVQQRIAEAVADEITRQLAVYFTQHADLAAR